MVWCQSRKHWVRLTYSCFARRNSVIELSKANGWQPKKIDRLIKQSFLFEVFDLCLTFASVKDQNELKPVLLAVRRLLKRCHVTRYTLMLRPAIRV